MKKTMLCILVCALCACFALSAAANGFGLPGTIYPLFERPVYANFAKCAADAQTNDDRPGDAAAFVMGNALVSEKVLFVAERGEDGYVTRVENMQAVYQGKDGPNWPRPEITIDDTGLLTLAYDFSDLREWYAFRERDGVWTLMDGGIQQKEGTSVSLSVVNGRLTYTSPGMFVYIPCEAGIPLSSFSIFRIPKSIEQATMVSLGLTQWGNPLPGGATATSSASETVPVYTGPGSGFARAENGAASMRTDVPFVVYGEENGWLLVEYLIDLDHYRFGFVEKALLPGAGAQALTLANEPATVKQDSFLTDDPTHSLSALRTLAADERVTFLAVLDGDWALVDTSMPDGTPVRGFVRTDALSLL